MVKELQLRLKAKFLYLVVDLAYFLVFSLGYANAQSPTNNCNAGVTALPVNGSCTPITWNIGTALGAPALPPCAGFTGTGSDGWGWFTGTGASTTITYNSIDDSQLFIYTDNGTACAGLTVIACADATVGGTETVTISTTLGQLYYVRVVQYTGGTTMIGTICVYTAGPCLGDDPCTAIPLTLGGPCNTNYSNVCSTSTPGVPAPSCSFYIDQDIWFSAVVPPSGNLNVLTNTGSITDGAMSVYTGACIGPLTELTCDDDSGPGTMPQLNLTGLTPGTTIYIRFWQYFGGGGTFKMCVSDPCPGGTPANDLPCNATFIPYGIYLPGNNGCSTNISDPATPGCFVNGSASEQNTVWFKFVATSACVKIKTSIGTLFDTQIALYSGAGGCGALGTALSCNNDFQPCAGGFTYGYSQLEYATTAGTTYYIMVDGYQAQTGSFSIEIIDGGAGCTNNFPPVAGQDCALPLPICSYVTHVADPGYQAVGNVCDFPAPSPCTGGTSGCSPGLGNPCTTTCLCSGERGSVWYAITINGTGFLEFTIVPNDYSGGFETDYDWALYGPNPSCGNLTSPIRCHYSPLGVTGMYSASAGVASPPYAPAYNSAFTEGVNVTAGQVYYLNVSNFSVSTSGFTLTIPVTTPIANTIAPGGTVIWTGQASTNWHDINNWGGCQIPDCRYNVVIPSVPANQPNISTADASCRSINVNVGAALTISANRQLMVCNDYTNDGTFTATVGTTVLFQDTCTLCTTPVVGIGHNQVLNGSMTGANKFWHVTVKKPAGRLVTTNQNLDMAGNFLVSGAAGFGGTFVATGMYHKIAGNFTIESAPLVANYTAGTTLEFNGTVQTYYNRGLLNSVLMNQVGAGTVTLLNHGLAGTAWMQLSTTGVLTLTNGKIMAAFSHVTDNRVDVFNRAAAAVSIGNTGSYVQGALRRYMPNIGGIGSYDFPVGYAAKGYERINFNIKAALPVTVNYWNVYFDGTNPASPPFAAECNSQYHNTLLALNHGWWTVQSSPTSLGSGSMDVTANNKIGDWTNTTGAAWTVQYNNQVNNTIPNWLLNPFPQIPCANPPVTAVVRYNMNVPVLFANVNPVWFATAQSLTPLPIELLNFEAQSLKSSIRLTWATASEKENKGFEVERSILPPDNFEKMGWLDGHGSTTTPQYYDFEDKRVKEGITYYYRLKQFDYNGNSEYSKIVAANTGTTDFIFNVIPNPYSGATNINYHLYLDAKVKVEVISTIGQKVATLTDEEQKAGLYQFDFSAKTFGYAEGIYLVRITVNDKIYTQKIVEKKE